MAEPLIGEESASGHGTALPDTKVRLHSRKIAESASSTKPLIGSSATVSQGALGKGPRSKALSGSASTTGKGQLGFVNSGTNAPTVGAPFLAFTDIVSGPATGNTDTSFGATSGTDGCYVSVWGNRLGATQGTGVIKVGGVTCRVIHWGPAISPWSPSNLVNGYHDMQIIVFQLVSTIPIGATTIQVTTDEGTSNTLPFTVRTGRILYFTSSGTSGGSGTWQAPYAFTDTLLNQKMNQSGDIVYLKDIIKTTQTRIGSGGANGLNGYTFTQERPGAIVAYPGSTNNLGVYGTSGANDAFFVFDGIVAPINGPDRVYPEGFVPWLVWAKLNIRGYIFPLDKRAGRTRVVGCTHANPSTSSTDASIFAIQGAYEQILGCEFFHTGSPGNWTNTTCNNCGTWTHTLYASPGNARSVRSETPGDVDFGYYPPYVYGQGSYECAWNYAHDCMTFDYWHMYNFNNNGGQGGAVSNYYENTTGDYPSFSSYLGGGYFHHNVIVDHAGNGASFTTLVAGDHYVYNNIMIRPGAMVSNADWGYTAPTQTPNITLGQAWGASNAFRIDAGPQDIDLAGCGGPLVVHIWHNTIYNAGDAHGQLQYTGGAVQNYGVFQYGEGGWDHNVELDVRNNVFYQQNGKRYVNPSSLTALTLPVDPTKRSSNLWYGAGVPPVWDSNTVNADPEFTTSAVTYPDVNLKATSPAIGVSTSITGTSSIPFASYDFHGRLMTMAGGEDIGAIQFPVPDVVDPDPDPTEPAWMVASDGQVPDTLEVIQIPNTSIGNTADYLATIRHPAFGNEENLITAESGFAVRTEGSVLIWGPGGGHSDGCFNQVVSLTLEDDEPAFVEEHAGSPNADLPATSPTTASAYYGAVGSQVPTGCHNYDRQYFINSQDRYVRIQTPSPYSAGGSPSLFQDCASFDWTSSPRTWHAPKTIPDCPSSAFQLLQDTTCQDPLTEEIYHWRGTTIRKWAPFPYPSGAWSTWMTGTPNQGQAQHPIACSGTEFCMLEMDADGTVYKIDMVTREVTTAIATGADAYGVQFPGFTSGQKTRGRLVWIPAREQYFFMRPSNGSDAVTGYTNKIFTLTWSGSTCTVAELPLTGVAIPVQNCLGPTARLQYIPNLEGCVYALNGDTDLFFFKV
jgi:hypothetical protein